jgi:hypothetical protein
MATITIGLSGSGVANGTRTYTISDPMVTRLIAAWRKISGLGAAATDAQVLANWADYFIDHTKRAVVDREQKETAPTSLDINPT